MNAVINTFSALISAAAIYLAIDPGRFAFAFVDAGGHRLRMHIVRTGGPTVVFESGGTGASGGPLEQWNLVQPAVARFATTVCYDRAGVGLSGLGPKPRDGLQIARELHLALQNAHVPPPYILVGHSFGGPFSRIFAGLYPQEVAGLLLTDPTQEEFIDWYHANYSNTVDDLAPEEREEVRATLAQAHHSPVPLGIPVVLITAMGPKKIPDFITPAQIAEARRIRPKWLKFHGQWLQSIANHQHLIDENSGHGIPIEDPQFVIAALRNLVDEVVEGNIRAPVRTAKPD